MTPWIAGAVLGALLVSSLSAQSYTISTAVGAGLPSNVPGKSTSFVANEPRILTADPAGNVFFVVRDSVLRLDAVTGLLTVIAGNSTPGYSGDKGPATSAQLNNPQGLALDSAGNLYIADSNNHVVRKVSGGVITTIVGNGTAGTGCGNGSAASTALGGPTGLAADAAGNLYVVDNFCVRKVSNGAIATVAGTGQNGDAGDNGQATKATLDLPQAVAVDAAGNLYIAASGGNVIRKVTASTQVITTVAGSGQSGDKGNNVPALQADLFSPRGVAVDSAGNIYIADTDNDCIREVSNGTITTLAGICGAADNFGGDNGPANAAHLSSPQGIAVDSAGNIYIADAGNDRVREISQGTITTIAGNGLIGDNGPAGAAQFFGPNALALDKAGNLYVSDRYLDRIRMISAATGIVTTVVGNGNAARASTTGPAASATLFAPDGIGVDPAGNLYISCLADIVLQVSNGLISPFAGNGKNVNGTVVNTGPATTVELGSPGSIAVDSTGDVYFVDYFNTTLSLIRKVSGGIVSIFAGSLNGPFVLEGSAFDAQFFMPTLTVDSTGDLLIADSGDNRIRKVSSASISTVAGTGNPGYNGDNIPATSAELNHPYGVAVDSKGNLFIADTTNNRIREVSAATHMITTIAGTNTAGFSGDYGPATAAELSGPTAIAVDSAGNIFFVDGTRIRVLTPATSSCSYSVSPTRPQFAAAGGNETISVQTTAFCPWTVSGLPSWMTVSGVPAGTGPGATNFTVAANTGGARTATITVGGVAVVVTQLATAPPSPFTSLPGQPVNGSPVAAAIANGDLFVLASDLETYQGASLSAQAPVALAAGASPAGMVVSSGNPIVLDHAGSITAFFSGTALQTLPANPNPMGITTMNLSGNGSVDLAVIGDNGIALFTANGDGTFTPGAGFDIPGRQAQLLAVAAGEFTGASLDDLVLSDAAGNLWLLPSDGMGGFGNPIETPVGANAVALAAGDFNGDGNLDVAAAAGNGVSLYFGDGAGNLTVGAAISVGSNPVALAAADFNGDGNLDLAVAVSAQNAVVILQGTGGGSFELLQPLAVGTQPTALAVGDLSGDGKPDIAVAGQQSRNVFVFLNGN